MARIHPSLFLSFAIVFGACGALCAQSDQSTPPGHVKVIPAPLGVDEAAGGHVKTLPAPTFTPVKTPFAIDNAGGSSARSIRVLSEEEMTRADRDLFADAESSIREQAGVENLEFDGGGWTTRELVCPALPNHMFLRFTRDDGTRSMSMFSAAIARNGNGRVHIIPIVRKGYSLFSPAPIGALTIAAFNRVRAEEGEGAGADWLGTGLCYAALAGANPEAGKGEAGTENPAASMPPTLTITAQGGAVIRFADMSLDARPMEWSMFFDPKGKLVKASHIAAYVGRPLKKTVVEGLAVPPNPQN
jgi:hypothetical protein